MYCTGNCWETITVKVSWSVNMQHCPFGYCRYISNKVNVGATENWKVFSYFSCGSESNLAFTYAGLFLHTRGNQDRKSVTSSADPKKKGIAHVGIKLQRLFFGSETRWDPTGHWVKTLIGSHLTKTLLHRYLVLVSGNGCRQVSDKMVWQLRIHWVGNSCFGICEPLYGIPPNKGTQETRPVLRLTILVISKNPALLKAFYWLLLWSDCHSTVLSETMKTDSSHSNLTDWVVKIWRRINCTELEPKSQATPHMTEAHACIRVLET